MVLAAPAWAQETPKRGGILNFAVEAEPPNYDCHANTSFAFIHPVRPHYSTLLRFDPASYPKIIGDLAQSWSVGEDHLSYTFKLKPNIKFHDGTMLTSEDVRMSYERIIHPPEGVVSARKANFEDVSAIETPDAQTIVFRLKKVNVGLLASFASPWDCIYSAAKLKQDEQYPIKNIMGTGPFTFVEHVRGSHWVGKRFIPTSTATRRSSSRVRRRSTRCRASRCWPSSAARRQPTARS
jgi:peptide/nickel transport system substrate-binding protein